MADQQHAAASDKEPRKEPDSVAEEVVNNLKSQGLFDQFRKECLEELESLEAYRLLKQRVENHVASFLSKYKWSEKMSKNSLRDNLRMNINRSEVLLNGVDRLVDQILASKIDSFADRIVPEIDKYLGIERAEEPAPGTDTDKDTVYVSQKVFSSDTTSSSLPATQTVTTRSNVSSSSSTAQGLMVENPNTQQATCHVKTNDKGLTLPIKKLSSGASQEQTKGKAEEARASCSTYQSLKADSSASCKTSPLCKDVKKEGLDYQLSKSQPEKCKALEIKGASSEGCRPFVRSNQDLLSDSKISNKAPQIGPKASKSCDIAENCVTETSKKNCELPLKKEPGLSPCQKSTEKNAASSVLETASRQGKLDSQTVAQKTYNKSMHGTTSNNSSTKEVTSKEADNCNMTRSVPDDIAIKNASEEKETGASSHTNPSDGSTVDALSNIQKDTKKRALHCEGGSLKDCEGGGCEVTEANVSDCSDTNAVDDASNVKECRSEKVVTKDYGMNCGKLEETSGDINKPIAKMEVAESAVGKDGGCAVPGLAQEEEDACKGKVEELAGKRPGNESHDKDISDSVEKEEEGDENTRGNIIVSEQTKDSNVYAYSEEGFEKPKLSTSSVGSDLEESSDADTKSSDHVSSASGRAGKESVDDVSTDSSKDLHSRFGQRKVKRRKRLISESEDDRTTKSARITDEIKGDLTVSTHVEGNMEQQDEHIAANDAKPKRGRGRPRKAEGAKRDSQPSSDSDMPPEGSIGPADVNRQNSKPQEYITESGSLKRQRSVGSESNASETGTEEKDIDMRRTKRQIKPKRCYSPSDGK
ncbi:biorientation of chromosomes in cell division protein 1-like 1 [Rhopilema esculentum]|uniref:biorientation of chromosomes in cell division protein 1-like 1 n=1 Tax=Rhopilema esculentum TaxID=499914 RepID=UPI0031D6C627|eukprot:gene12465-3139_t